MKHECGATTDIRQHRLKGKRGIFHTEKKKNIVLKLFEDSNIVSSCIFNQNLVEMEEKKINISKIRV